jgi:hypothetical protein
LPAEASLEAKPFVFNQLFRLNENLTQPKPVLFGEKIPVLLLDDVLGDPQGARDMIGRSPVTNWLYPEGTRNFIDYYDCRLRYPVFPPVGLIAIAGHAIQEYFRVAVEPQSNAIDINWFMQVAAKPVNYACPHQDVVIPGKRTFTCLLFLNSPAECSGGTGFFKFRETQSLVSDGPFEKALANDKRLRSSELDYWPRDPDAYWEHVGTVDMVTGRMLIFPAQYFHAAFHPEDSFFDFPRLTLAFWMVG